MEQWDRLMNELGPDMIKEFSQEYFEETAELWISPPDDPYALDVKAFGSRAHRSAGAGGTLGFKRLRMAFLAMEYANDVAKAHGLEPLMLQVFDETRAWVSEQV